jgi:hypothetical protein
VRTFFIGLIAVVWVATLLGLSGWVWMRSRRTGLDARRAIERRRALRDRRRPERDLERVVREATSAGVVVVVARRGSDPVRVTWSDGSVWFFYRDEQRYVDARSRGLAPTGPTHLGEPPELGAQQSPDSPGAQG